MNIKTMSEYRVRVPVAQVSASASENTSCTSEALYGERVTLLDTQHDWGLIRQSHDSYQGFIKLDDIKASSPGDTRWVDSSHWVSQRSTLLFRQPDLKSSIAHRIPFASELCLTSIADSAFSQTHCGHFVWTEHCLELKQKHELDPLNLAKSIFLGAPYRWGGRSPEGADCSGLIQLLARSQGLSIPRDSGDQEAFIEQQIPANDFQALDIVYWPGHTGILLDSRTLLHATAHTLSCIVEPLHAVIKRAGPVSSVRRLFT
ncbi:C40 family peptidase [Granulosicoccus sp.]|nr:C40 family peptidase [Granulosicoccus sp.]MDB4224188.1 C40 family peptidase [Granulosicoccus sp.]